MVEAVDKVTLPAFSGALNLKEHLTFAVNVLATGQKCNASIIFFF